MTQQLTDTQLFRNWVNRNKPSYDWTIADNSKTITSYQLNGVKFIVIFHHPNKELNGYFEILIPISLSKDVVTAFEQLNKYCEVN